MQLTFLFLIVIMDKYIHIKMRISFDTIGRIHLNSWTYADTGHGRENKFLPFTYLFIITISIYSNASSNCSLYFLVAIVVLVKPSFYFVI